MSTDRILATPVPCTPVAPEDAALRRDGEVRRHVRVVRDLVGAARHRHVDVTHRLHLAAGSSIYIVGDK